MIKRSVPDPETTPNPKSTRSTTEAETVPNAGGTTTTLETITKSIEITPKTVSTPETMIENAVDKTVKDNTNIVKERKSQQKKKILTMSAGDKFNVYEEQTLPKQKSLKQSFRSKLSLIKKKNSLKKPKKNSEKLVSS